MADCRGVAATIRYLRFPLEGNHRQPLQDGSSCPHCSARRVHKWGRFSGRQRYRCCGCGRTFSTFTGTALHYLKHPDRWSRFLWCIEGRLTIRNSAAVLDVNKDTALRWRHRLLDSWKVEPKPRLKGRLLVGDFCIPCSWKGRKPPSRPSRRRGEPWSAIRFLQTEPVTVLVVWERSPALFIAAVGMRRLELRDYERWIAPRTRWVRGMVGASGPASPLGRFARGRNLPYEVEQVGLWPREVYHVRRELRRWLRPFRGVSTHRLNNYLEWFRRSAAARPPTVPADRAGEWVQPPTVWRTGRGPYRAIRRGD